MLNMDTTRRPVRPSEWAAVLDAVYNAQPSDEQTWLEWKSTLDLRSKEQMATIVSKAIIALANRDPDEAAATVGGIGILLIGIEPGAARGVTQVDNADLDQMISTYIGTDGPVWQPHWDQYQGKTILIIEVSPPQWGDPPHAFRKTYTPISDGQIYVRKRARSVPSDHRDVRRLADRYATGSQDKGLDVAVTIDYPAELSRYTWTEDNLQSFLDAERDRLMEPLAKERIREARKAADRISAAAISGLTGFAALQKSVASISSQPYGLVQTVPESRTAEDYEAEVEDYLKRVKAAWPDAMRTAAAHLIQRPIFKVMNRSDRNYRQLEVKLHVAGDADAAEYDPDASELDLWNLMPPAPRIWGPYKNDLTGLVRTSYISPGPLSFQPRGPSTTVERGGSFTLTFPPVDLRPGRTEVLERDWTVLIPSWRTDPVVATWAATATNVDGQAHGEFTILFNAEDVNLCETLIRTVLDVAEED